MRCTSTPITPEGHHRQTRQVAHLPVVAGRDRLPDGLAQLVQVDPVAVAALEALLRRAELQGLGLGGPEEVAVEEQLEDPPVLLGLGDGRRQRLAKIALVGPRDLVQRREGVQDLGGPHRDALGAEVLEEREEASRGRGHPAAPRPA
jgi:hypothetical protein